MAERWQPLTRGMVADDAQRVFTTVGTPVDEVWSNDLYECQVRYLHGIRDDALHLSIKLRDRSVVRDWRHLQAIKNEVAGPEREAVELFPAESRLVDQANQTHLWVMPVDTELPVGWRERVVYTQEQSDEVLREHGIAPGKGRQRPWQPGISTGPDYR